MDSNTCPEEEKSQSIVAPGARLSLAEKDTRSVVVNLSNLLFFHFKGICKKKASQIK